MKRIGLSLTFALLLVACSDGGVVVGNSSDSSTTGGSSDGTGGTDGGGLTDSVGGSNTDSNAGDSSDVVIPPENPSIEVADIEAARALQQASFGPTTASIAEFRALGSRAAWIDNQIALPTSLTEPYTRANSNGSNRIARHDIWWENAIDGQDQLRQRVAFALSQIFVVSDVDAALSQAQYGISNYYDMLARNAFGNYRELLEEVTLHPVMGVYLSMVRNERANPDLNIRPDENYAREIMQLFSLGLFRLNNRGEKIPLGNPEPAYTQEIVQEFARVFTGWDYPNSRYWGDTNITALNYEGQMVPVEAFHDSDSKALLSGLITPANLSASADLELALDNIFNHPNVGPYISKQLIQRLVTSNPTPEYVERVASTFNDNGSGERGDLEAVIRAILLDSEAVNGHTSLSDFGKIREPVIKLAHFFRALEGIPGPEAGRVHSTADAPMYELYDLMGQAVLRSPSVFNFYSPSNPLNSQSDLVAPEMQVMSEGWLAATHVNYHHQIYRFHNRADLSDDNPEVTLINLEPLVALAANSNRLLDWYDLMFFAGSMPNELRQNLFDFLRTANNAGIDRFAQVQDTLFIIMASAYVGVQR